MSTPETDAFYAWGNAYREWMITERRSKSTKEDASIRVELILFMQSLKEVLKPLAIALEQNGIDSSPAWKAIGNPLAPDIEETLDRVWELAKRFEARQEGGRMDKDACQIQSDDDKEYRQAFEMWQAGKHSWSKITELMGNPLHEWRSFSQAVKRWAKRNGETLRKGKPGSKRKCNE